MKTCFRNISKNKKKIKIQKPHIVIKRALKNTKKIKERVLVMFAYNIETCFHRFRWFRFFFLSRILMILKALNVSFNKKIRNKISFLPLPSISIQRLLAILYYLVAVLNYKNQRVWSKIFFKKAAAKQPTNAKFAEQQQQQRNNKKLLIQHVCCFWKH